MNREELRRYSQFYRSPRYLGQGEIIRRHLGLDDDFPLPLVIPHGVMTPQHKVALDGVAVEPIYLVHNRYNLERLRAGRARLLFPHPWLLMRAEKENPKPHGTLIIGPPPSLSTSEQVLRFIEKGELEEPIGFLMKARGETGPVRDWWQRRGVEVHCAGAGDDQGFFYELRSIFDRFRVVAGPNMSSALIFAAARGKRLRAIPNIRLRFVDVPHWDRFIDLDDREGVVRGLWRSLIFGNETESRRTARDLLGDAYLDSPAALRARLLQAMQQLEAPLHLGSVNRAAAKLVCAVAPTVPAVMKLFPEPWRKLGTRLRALTGTQELGVVSGCDFSHYGVCGDAGRIEFKRVRARTLRAGASPGMADEVPLPAEANAGSPSPDSALDQVAAGALPRQSRG